MRGRVQGVWYRASTRQHALAWELSGYARNRKDGSVEVLALGAEQALAQLEDWLWRGPTAAHVDIVESSAGNCERLIKGDFFTA